jgi:hypothetical protein
MREMSAPGATELPGCTLCLTFYPDVPFGTDVADVDETDLSIWLALHSLVCQARHYGCDHAHE